MFRKCIMSGQTRIMNNIIKCTHCGRDIEINKALKHQYESEVLDEVNAKHKQELEHAKQQAVEESGKKVREQFELQLKNAREEAQENSERNKQLIEQITQLTKEMRQLRVEKDEVNLKMEKELVQKEDQIRQDAQKKAEEESHTKIAAKDKQLADTLKELEDARRKLQQGSQQTQGEVFELEFEELLTRQYPNDKILPVGKGIRGGDVLQEVWDSNGNFAGKILWELKNTKTWQEPWMDKLKVDQRAATADEAVLISEVLPSDMKYAGFRKGLWVTQQSFVIPLADTMRAKLIQLQIVKNSVQGKNEKMEFLYSYLSGTEFKHRVEAIVEAFTNMQSEIEKEKRYFANKWARDEKNIRQVIDSTYGMHGDFKGIIGGGLAQIKGLELLELEEGT